MMFKIVLAYLLNVVHETYAPECIIEYTCMFIIAFLPVTLALTASQKQPFNFCWYFSCECNECNF